jgi:ankyrin repeat protein
MGCTSLHYASLKGHVKVLNCLVHHMADVDFADITRSTPLLCANFGVHIESSTTLVENGANLNFQIKSGLSPLYIVIAMNHKAMAQFFMGQGANVDLTDDGLMPLHIASYLGHDFIAKFVIENDTNADIAGNHDKSALDYAFQN